MKSSPALAIKTNSLLRTTSIVGMITFFSRILGFMRDMVLAHVFGAQAGLDAFLVAYKIPNLLRRVFAEGTLSQAFIPILAELQLENSPHKTREFIGNVAGTMVTILSVLSIVIMLASPVIIYLSAPGFTQDPIRYQLATEMLRVVFPYIVLISLSALCGAVLNAFGYFVIPAFASVMLNVAMISAALVFSPNFTSPIKALAWGVVIAGVLQVCFQLPQLVKAGLSFKLKVAWRDPLVQRVIKQILPALYALSANQVHLFINTLFASFLVVGSISWLYFSVQLAFFPLGVFALTIATVITPQLSRDQKQHDQVSFMRTLDWGVKLVCVLAIPSVIGLILLAKPLLVTLFQYGHFSPDDVLKTRAALIAYAIGIPAHMLVRILTAACYTRGDYKTPVRVSVLATGLNIVFDAVLIYFWQYVGLALALSLTALVQLFYLGWICLRNGTYRLQPGMIKFLSQLALASGILILWLNYYEYPWELWLSWGAAQRAWHLSWGICAAAALYLISLYAAGYRFHDN